MEITLSHLPEPVEFQFFANFSIDVRSSEMAGFTVEQMALLRAIAASPLVLRQIARMALETDLAGITGRHLSDLFIGPSTEEILDCVLPGLAGPEKAYWNELKDGPGDTLHQELMPVFLAFQVRLRRAGIEELQSSSNLFRKTVGPTLDASDLNAR